MTREKLAEKIARACCEANGQEADSLLAGGGEPEWTFYVIDAEAALAAIEAAGFRIVPVDATMAQLSAGQSAWINDPLRLSSTLYRAMVTASPINAKGSGA